MNNYKTVQIAITSDTAVVIYDFTQADIEIILGRKFKRFDELDNNTFRIKSYLAKKHSDMKDSIMITTFRR
jgi:hypothetical protein